MDKWNPTTEWEQDLKNALLKLKTSTDCVILTPANEKAAGKPFILQTNSYFGAFPLPVDFLTAYFSHQLSRRM